MHEAFQKRCTQNYGNLISHFNRDENRSIDFFLTNINEFKITELNREKWQEKKSSGNILDKDKREIFFPYDATKLETLDIIYSALVFFYGGSIPDNHPFYDLCRKFVGDWINYYKSLNIPDHNKCIFHNLVNSELENISFDVMRILKNIDFSEDNIAKDLSSTQKEKSKGFSFDIIEFTQQHILHVNESGIQEDPEDVFRLGFLSLENHKYQDALKYFSKSLTYLEYFLKKIKQNIKNCLEKIDIDTLLENFIYSTEENQRLIIESLKQIKKINEANHLIDAYNKIKNDLEGFISQLDHNKLMKFFLLSNLRTQDEILMILKKYNRIQEKEWLEKENLSIADNFNLENKEKYLGEAERYFRFQKFGVSLDCFLKIIQINNTQILAVQLNQGICLYYLNYIDDAEKLLLQIYDKDPEFTYALKYLCLIWYQKALNLVKEGENIDELTARKILKQALHFLEYERDEKILFLLGNLYLALGDIKEAKLYFDEVKFLSPDNLDIKVKLIEISFFQKDFDKMLELVDEYLEEETDNPKIWYLLSTYYFYIGKKYASEVADIIGSIYDELPIKKRNTRSIKIEKMIYGGQNKEVLNYFKIATLIND